MDLRVIRYLIEIVDSGGFAKASEKVHITQPALSKAIQQLEHELDVTLLKRGKRGTRVKLTPAGELGYRHGQTLLANKQALLNELAAQRGLTSGQLKLGLAPLGSAELFAPVIAQYRDTYPKIEMELLVRGSVEQKEALLRGEIELATGIIAFDKEFEGILVRDEPMVVILPKHHVLASEKSLRLEQIAEEPQIMFEAGFSLHSMVLDSCEQAGFTPKNITRISQAEFGIALVAAGAGNMLLPKMIAERHRVAGVASVPLVGSDLRWQMSLFWRKEQALSFAAKAMIEMIKQTSPV